MLTLVLNLHSGGGSHLSLEFQEYPENAAKINADNLTKIEKKLTIVRFELDVSQTKVRQLGKNPA